MSSRQNPGIGGIQDPKHVVAAGVHKAQRNEIGPESPKSGGHRDPSRWERIRAWFKPS